MRRSSNTPPGPRNQAGRISSPAPPASRHETSPPRREGQTVGSVLRPGLGCFKKLGAKLRILLVVAAPVGRPRPRVTLAHASHLGAEVHCVEVHSDAVGLQHTHELVRDLNSDALLDGEAPREYAHQAGELGDADDLFVRDVADEGVAVEGQRVVLAQGVELDGAFDDLADVAVGTAMALGRKRGQELGVAFVTRRGLVESAQIPSGCLPGAWRVEVHAKCLKDLSGIALELLPLLRRNVAWSDLFTLSGLFGVLGVSQHSFILVSADVYEHFNAPGM